MNKQPKHNKSIGIKIKKARSLEGKRKCTSEWTNEWKMDQTKTIQLIHQAVTHGQREEAKRLLSQLMVITEKRFTGLNTVFSVILADNTNKAEEKEAVDTVITTPITDVAPADITPTTAAPVVNTQDTQSYIIREYKNGRTIKEIANYLSINDHKVVKILVTAGIYTSDMYTTICNLRNQGYSDLDICDKLKISKSTINDYTPYKKGIYNADNPTDNALKIRQSRNKK